MMLPFSRLVQLAFFVALALAVLSVEASESHSAIHSPRAHRPSSSLAIGKSCRADKHCGKNSYCHRKTNKCTRKLAEGQKCVTSHQCVSRTCDNRTKKCLSTRLSVGSQCYSSASCRTGNCQKSLCTPKQSKGKSCYKNSNCKSGYCKNDKCAIRHNNNPDQPDPNPLQPAIPWSKDLSKITNIDPLMAVKLLYTDTGVVDPVNTKVFAKLKGESTLPVVVLPHSNRMEVASCDGGDLEIAFTDKEAYMRAKSTWSSRHNTLVIVTHTDACSKPASLDDRTFWKMVAGDSNMQWDDEEYDVTLSVTEIAYADTLDHVDISFGSNDGGSATDSGNACPSFSGSSVDGLPAVACGSNFDQRLDAQSGYFEFDGTATEAEIEGFFGEEIDANDLQRRLSLNPFRAVARAVSKAVDKAGSYIREKAKAVGSELKDFAGKAVDAAGKGIGGLVDFALETIENLLPNKFNKSFSLDITPPKKKFKESKTWGNQFQIFHGSFDKKSADGKNTAKGEIAAYCVDCGIKGEAALEGNVKFSIKQLKIKEGNVKLNGKFYAGIFLGLEAEAEASRKDSIPIAQIPVFAFIIPGVLVIGPAITLDAEYEIGIKAQGNLLIGGSFSMPDFRAELNLLDPSKSTQSGFEPKIEKKFEVNGEVDIYGSIGLPVKVGVGVTIIPIKFDQRIALTSTPSISATAKYAYSNVPDRQGKCNNGVAYELSAKEVVALQIFSFDPITIFKWPSDDKPLISDCKLFGSKPSTGGDSSGSDSSGGDSSGGDSSGGVSSGGDSSNGESSGGDSSGGDSSNGDSSGGGASDADQSGGDQSGDGGDDSKKRSLHSRTSFAVRDTADAVQTNADTGDDSGDNNLESLAPDFTAIDGATFSTITDENKKYQFGTDDEGNARLYKFDENKDELNQFLTDQGTVVIDRLQRLPVYFPATMKAFGVSRLRFVDTDKIPKGSKSLILTPIPDDSKDGAGYVALSIASEDADPELYWPVICQYTNEMSKFFLVKDYIKGIDRLADQDLLYTVTGGTIKYCEYIPLVGPNL